MAVGSVEAIQIVGAGPAGSAAAITALRESADVHMTERTRVTRHKVCGEFIAPEAHSVLEEFGVWEDFVKLSPAALRRCRLHFGRHLKQWTFSDPAFGLSRRAFDHLLLERAASLGAAVSRGENFRPAASSGRLIFASGRTAVSNTKPRLFGFKAHFTGPADDAVELYFTRSGYVGINHVEQHRTNVCGLAPEDVLRNYGFDLDEFIRHAPALAERLGPLSRCTEWFTTGPLHFDRPQPTAETAYPAGDALGFVDPFTGSGILNALVTGRLAGMAAVRQVPVSDYIRSCRALLDRPLAVSALFRAAIQRGYADHIAWLVPGRWIYRLTRLSAA